MKKIFKLLVVFFILISISFIIIALSLKATLVQSKDITIDIKGINNVQWITGMNGVENILLSNTNNDFYVTDLEGNIYHITMNKNVYSIEESRKLGNFALGLAWANKENSELYVGISSNDWLDPGSSIFKVSSNLHNITKITSDYPGLNGLATDSEYELYITTGDFNFINPKGSLVKIGILNNETVLTQAKSANGLFYDDKENSLYYSEVYSGISKYNILNNTVSKVLGKSKIVEGFDDFCIDNSNNIWIADPPSGFIKCYIPEKKTVYHIRIKGFGVASSCRIGNINGENYIYITEIKKENSKKYDGRGVLIIPLKELMKSI